VARRTNPCQCPYLEGFLKAEGVRSISTPIFRKKIEGAEGKN